MKSLKPSHREKKRYLLLKGTDVSKKVIEDCILEFIGTLGFAEASPQIVKQNKTSLILVINRKSLDKIRASFLMSKKDIQITKVSGAIKNLK